MEQKGTLKLRNGQVVEIAEQVVVGDIVVVLVRVPRGQVMTENVFGISKSGELLWQIERIPETATDPANRYVGIVSVGSDTVRAANWNDLSVDIQVETGRVLKKIRAK